MKDYYYFHRL